jgi:hypothetical protein
MHQKIILQLQNFFRRALFGIFFFERISCLKKNEVPVLIVGYFYSSALFVVGEYAKLQKIMKIPTKVNLGPK